MTVGQVTNVLYSFKQLFSDSEKSLFTRLLIKFEGSLKIKLINGNHWDTPECKKESNVVNVRDLSKTVRFSSKGIDSKKIVKSKKEPLFSEPVNEMKLYK